MGSINLLVLGMNSAAFAARVTVGGLQVAAVYANTHPASWARVNPNLATNTAYAAFVNSSLLNTAVTATTTGTAGQLAGKTDSALDLVQLSGVAGAVSEKFLGTLALTTVGEVYFTAVPEPSVYAAVLGIATLGFVALRRRKQAQLVA